MTASQASQEGRPRGARERILDAALDVVTASGYEHTSVQMVCERAGLPRSDFDAHFSSLEDCALQLLDDFFQPARREFEAAFAAQPRWPDSLRAASYAVCDWIVAHPREVRFGAVELLKVGEMGVVRYATAFRTFIPMVEAGRDQADDPEAIPEMIGERVMGSMAAMLTKRLRAGSVDPHSVVPELMYAAVLPYRGEEIAQRELSIPPPATGNPPQSTRDG